MLPRSERGGPSTRDRVLEFVRSHPGTSARRVQRALRLGWGETAYHLRELLHQRLLVRERLRRRDSYFQPGFDPVDRVSLMAMQQAVSHRILVSTAGARALTFSNLAADLGLGHSVVAYYLRSLIANGLVIVEGDATTRSYRAHSPERVRDLEARFGHTFERSIADTIAEVWGGVLPD